METEKSVDNTSVIMLNGRPTQIQNEAGVSQQDLQNSESMRELASQLSTWVDNARSATGRTSMFDRGTYTPPDNPYDEMRAARHAVRYDSIVSGVAEVTEAFAFNGVKWESENPDEADVFNQLAINMNLDAVVRKMWKEEFTYSQFVAAKMWGWQEFTVRGKTSKGVARKKKYRVWAPLQIRILDSAKVVPIGMGPLGGEGLAWQSTPGEIGYYQASYQGEVIDPLMVTFFQGSYTPGFEEASELAHLGVNTSRLLVMNPEWVFRHTTTKPDYERFADVRMKSVFALLDMKKQLMAADRASLIGAANYILLIRKGDRDTPAQQEEIANLKENYNYIAKMPVIISDHRLTIDIIAPKTDFTLSAEKYDLLDSRILARLLGTLTLGGRTQSNDTQDTLSAAVARVMENRRHMFKRTLEVEIARAVVEHPKNKGLFETEPNLVYTPRNIALSMEANYSAGLLALRTQREISRETILEYFGLDESVEAMRMEMEAEFYDDIFKTEIPFSGGSPTEDVDPNLNKKDDPEAEAAVPITGKPSSTAKGPNGTPVASKVSGATGGRPKGGGSTPASPQAQTKPKTANGNPSTQK